MKQWKCLNPGADGKRTCKPKGPDRWNAPDGFPHTALSSVCASEVRCMPLQSCLGSTQLWVHCLLHSFPVWVGDFRLHKSCWLERCFTMAFSILLFATCNCFLSWLYQFCQLRKMITDTGCSLFSSFEFLSEDLSLLGLPRGISL